MLLTHTLQVGAAGVMSQLTQSSTEKQGLPIAHKFSSDVLTALDTLHVLMTIS